MKKKSSSGTTNIYQELEEFIGNSGMIKGVSDAVAICPVQELIPQHNIF